MPGRIVGDDERRESEIFHLEQDIARWLNYKIQVLLDINKEKDETLRLQLEIRAKELESIYFKVLNDHSVCCATKVSQASWEYLNNGIPRLQQKISDKYNFHHKKFINCLQLCSLQRQWLNTLFK